MIDDLNLSGKTAVITGATSGIGCQAALALARAGVEVIGVGRHPGRCQAAEQSIREVVPESRVRYLLADLSRQAQVRELAGKIREAVSHSGSSRLDVLVNNAGVYSQKFVKTEDGVELTLAVNHIAPFLLTNLLLPLLQDAPSGRVLTVSSGSHFRTWLDPARLNDPLLYHGLWAYKVSKLANILFTLELQRRLVGTSIRAFAVDPGLVNTEMGFKGTSGLTHWVWSHRRTSGVSPDQPARTILFLSAKEGLPEALYWHDCLPVPASRQAQRPDLARRLWEASEAMCGIVNPYIKERS
ncbi:MAG: SDR family NAD(P)-dependent oxidoreductase [Chloroflexi bacterium]|nr:SDR family NAD(P)-dependent oxidoreductase [Chloroflexota bacterium]